MQLGIHQFSYSVSEVQPYINWLYFYHAWGLTGKPLAEQQQLRSEAEAMLADFSQRGYQTHALCGLFEANSRGDDIVISPPKTTLTGKGLEGTFLLPMLRQQRPAHAGQPNLCLADYIRPVSSGQKDYIGVFAATMHHATETDFSSEPYQKMMAQTLADRLAEATAERLHQQVRKNLWGYAPQEQLSIEQLLREDFQGIRPAVGYPSLPDTSINFLIADLLNIARIGIRLTESGMMVPHASVSGLMFAHPKAHYFDLGKIGSDQLRDYARRRGLPVTLMRRFLASSLMEEE